MEKGIMARRVCGAVLRRKWARQDWQNDDASDWLGVLGGTTGLRWSGRFFGFGERRNGREKTTENEEVNERLRRRRAGRRRGRGGAKEEPVVRRKRRGSPLQKCEWLCRRGEVVREGRGRWEVIVRVAAEGESW